MNETTTDAQDGAEHPIVLDPFAFWPASASKISGLGGIEIDPDPAYVFHTHYAEVGPGQVRCTLRFENMIASFGTIVLRINALGMESGARAETIKTWSVALREIAAADGEIATTFDAAPGTRYAVLGHAYGETKSAATKLDLTLQTIQGSKIFEEQLADARKSVFGRRLFRRANRMISEDSATLTDPVSQTCTSMQFEEPAYGNWLTRLHLPMHKHRKQWEFIYILQTLERYGMLKPGARGVGFGVGIEPLPAAMAAMGVDVLASDLGNDDARARDWSVSNQHAASVEQLRYPAICGDEAFERHVKFRPVDMNSIDDDLREFDFTWSSCSLEHLGSIEAGLAFIRNSIGCLKKGGLAVHTTELNLTSNDDTIDNEGTVLFRRRDIERLAVDLASRGHLVAQIKYDLGNTQHDDYVDVPPYSNDNHLKLALGKYVTTSFGIIVRRGDR
ncbi:hypothetical protein [Sphingomonas faeni]|uniref:hypothetical protein n=1 Tax=Sphingomonas faeni TaxID=185950 RepID=UPI00334DCF0E